MEWIKFEVATLDKPEVLQLAEMIECSPDEVVGKLLRVWAWFDKNSVDGNAPGVTKVTLMLFIDRLVARNGFAACMKKVGWLTDSGLPNFDYHNGESAKKRALTSRRQEKYRNAKVTQKVTLPASPEKRREEYINPPTPLLGKPVGPQSAAHSVQRAMSAIAETREAAKHAVPPPDSVMEKIRRG